ncbi:hypothetical protein BC831DRAFT_513794 [Entophlyctis helioformis]|nr:hypothetical protein BC831DRAFT_513794 [Entophlyctis helioformis]
MPTASCATNTAFSQPDVAATVGDVIVWSFGSASPASPVSVTQVSNGTSCTSLAGGIDSGLLVAPQTFQWTAKTPGNWWYVSKGDRQCASGLRGVVRVAAASASASASVAPSIGTLLSPSRDAAATTAAAFRPAAAATTSTACATSSPAPAVCPPGFQTAPPSSGGVYDGVAATGTGSAAGGQCVKIEEAAIASSSRRPVASATAARLAAVLLACLLAAV